MGTNSPARIEHDSRENDETEKVYENLQETLTCEVK